MTRTLGSIRLRSETCLRVHPRGGVRPIDALRSSRQQLPREDVTVSVHVRGAVVVRAVKKRSTLVVALLVLVLLRSKRYLYGKHNTSTALTGPGDTGVDGRLRPKGRSELLLTV